MISKFNSAQKKAITAGNGPVLIIAGAGSGKTSVLTQRIMYLIEERNIKPNNVIAVTFTNKAANEMKLRINRLLHSSNKQYSENDRIWIGTFHSVCARILHKYSYLLGYQQRFNIYDKNDTLRLIRKCIKGLNLDSKQYKSELICRLIENAKNQLIDENQYCDDAIGFFNKKVGQVYQVYQTEMMKNQSFDYGDLIQKTVLLFNQFPDVVTYYQAKFHHILVDEYQDINHAQYTFIQLLAEKSRNLFVVGDPDQSIYRFRGAELSNIIHFEEHFPNCRVFKLEQNYRSSNTILKGASVVIQNNRYRKEKNLWTNRKEGEKIKFYEANSSSDEAEFISREISRLKKIKKLCWRHFAILYRTNAQSRPFEEILARSNIPFKLIGGIKFYERKEIKDLISLLKLLDNPHDRECCFRWLEIYRMGIGMKGFQKLTEIAEQENKSILEILPAFLNIPGNRVSNENQKQMKTHLQIFEDLRNMKRTNISTITENLIRRTRYYSLLSSKDDRMKIAHKIENVKTFIQSIIEYEKLNQRGNLNDFLTYIALISGAEDHVEESSTGDAVHLMTLHCAKGLEFPVVFLSGLEEGIFPHHKSLTHPLDLEEERRLCYVGMTRAMESLYLTYCWRRNMDGRTTFNQKSRFFNEIPKEYLEKTEMTPNDLFFQPEVNTPGDGKLIQVDDPIIHPDWGQGKVISKKEVENDQYITVHFEDYGIKKLSLKYAPIKKIEKELHG